MANRNPDVERARAELTRLQGNAEEIEASRRARDRSRWIRFSLIPMLFVFVVVFVGATVVLTAINRQQTSNEMVLARISANTDKIVETLFALSGASRERQIELAQRQIAILCVQAILPQDRTKENVAKCLSHLPRGSLAGPTGGVG